VFRIRVLVVALFTASLLACAVAPSTSPLLTPEPTNRAEVLVLRPFLFAGAGVPLTFGFGEGTESFVSLKTSEYVVASVSASVSTIAIRIPQPERHVFKLNLTPGHRTCLSVGQTGSLGLPAPFLLGHVSHILEEIPCPSSEALAKYRQVTIEYRNP
jgi:hypothetical protein